MYFIKELSLTIIFLLTILLPFTTAVNVKYRKIASTKTSSYYSTRHVASGAGCGALCSQNSSCVSANYNKDTGACELNDDHGELDSPLQQQAPWMLYREKKICDPTDVRIGNKCIRHITTYQNWREAKEHCESIGYQLVVIESSAELQNIANMLGNELVFWVGGKCVDGTCRWVDGQLVDSEHIDTDQKYHTDNGCLLSRFDGSNLVVITCEHEDYSFCSRYE